MLSYYSDADIASEMIELSLAQASLQQLRLFRECLAAV